MELNRRILNFRQVSLSTVTQAKSKDRLKKHLQLSGILQIS